MSSINYDLALIKTAVTTSPVFRGQLVEFQITVLNQGTEDAAGIELMDYVDLSMWEAFDDSLNPSWHHRWRGQPAVQLDGVGNGRHAR